jgi:hypothetical protein
MGISKIKSLLQNSGANGPEQVASLVILILIVIVILIRSEL